MMPGERSGCDDCEGRFLDREVVRCRFEETVEFCLVGRKFVGIGVIPIVVFVVVPVVIGLDIVPVVIGLVVVSAVLVVVGPRRVVSREHTVGVWREHLVKPQMQIRRDLEAQHPQHEATPRQESTAAAVSWEHGEHPRTSRAKSSAPRLNPLRAARVPGSTSIQFQRGRVYGTAAR